MGRTSIKNERKEERVAALESLLSFARSIARGRGAWTSPELRAAFIARLTNGEDPLGDCYSGILLAEERRSIGAVLTPPRIVHAMIEWAKNEAQISGAPQRIVDAGAGTGRFAMAAARTFPEAVVIAVENDPALTTLLRANLKEIALTRQISVVTEDFRSVTLEKIKGPTLFLANPPYVRHHQISTEWKQWYVDICARHGIKASQLAGTHLHFFAKIAEIGRYGDYGCLITASEWLDVGYGAALRGLLANGLGGVEIHVLQPTAEAFPGTMTTAAITGFRIGRRPPELRVRSVDMPSGLDRLQGGRAVDWGTATQTSKWSLLVRDVAKPAEGMIELGELCRVHRGQVTGANRIWIAGKHVRGLPDSVLKPTITHAAELFAADPSLDDYRHLARVIDLPADLDEIPTEERAAVEGFIAWARVEGAADTYIARHRSPWWAVRLGKPAPIICTYMARRAPAFVRNRANARILNIAHGIYPRDPMTEDQLGRLLVALRTSVSQSHGRQYAGGLLKFEPRELERIPLPPLESIDLSKHLNAEIKPPTDTTALG